MPSDQRLRLHDDQELAPRNQPGQPDERQADRVISSPRPNLPLDVQRQLLAQEQILGGELGARSQQRRGEPDDVCQNACDGAEVQRRTALGHSRRIARGEQAGATAGEPAPKRQGRHHTRTIGQISCRIQFLRTTTAASAVSTTISECWNQWLRAPVEPRPPSRIASCGANRDPRRAGTSPKPTAATTATAVENIRTRQSSLSEAASPIASGTSRSRKRMAGSARATPASAPRAASARLSVKN